MDDESERPAPCWELLFHPEPRHIHSLWSLRPTWRPRGGGSHRVHDWHGRVDRGGNEAVAVCMLAMMIGSGVDGQCAQCSRRTWTALPAPAEDGVGTKMQIIRPSKLQGLTAVPKPAVRHVVRYPNTCVGQLHPGVGREPSGRLILIGNNWRLGPLDSAHRVQHHSCQFLRKRSSHRGMAALVQSMPERRRDREDGCLEEVG